MSQEKPLHPFPLTIGKHGTELLDAGNFGVITIDEGDAILQDWCNLPNPTHWALMPEAHREISEEEAAATTLHTFVSYNSHQMLVDALTAIRNDSRNLKHDVRGMLADEVLKKVDYLILTARAELYEPSGEVAQ